MTERTKENIKNGLIDFTAGFLGGTALVYVGQPLDTVKVKMQTFPNLYANMAQCFMHTWRTEGVRRGLYAGTAPALVSNISENSILFLSYGLCQKFVQKVTSTETVNELSALSNATAGFFASFFSSVAICPTELVKCRLQAMYELQKHHQNPAPSPPTVVQLAPRIGPAQLFTQILRTEGPLGLFKGLVPTLIREMPGYFFFFGGYEGTRTLLSRPEQSKDDIGPVRTMVAGAVGGCVFWTITYPVDVAKSRIQVNNSQESTLRIILQILRNDGLSVLYSGLTPTLVRTIPATAVLFVTYEYSKQLLQRFFQ